MEWTNDKVAPLLQDKTIVFAPGGTSRWYFLEHGDLAVGYGQKERFQDYGRRALQRTVELCAMMFADGIRTIFVVGFVPGQNMRTGDYNKNLAWAYSLLVDSEAQELYNRHEVGALFRGGWADLFQQLSIDDLMDRCEVLEQETHHHKHWLIWLTQDKGAIPDSMFPFIMEHMRAHGRLPDRHTLCATYYKRPIEHIDMLIGHNKTSLEGLIPPLMTVGDAYFSVTPSYYMKHKHWRSILYDHLFARQGHYREYAAMAPDTLESLRAFYKINEGVTLGVGMAHPESQTWRPRFMSDPHS